MGERWEGVKYKVFKSEFIMSPGIWKWEEVVVIPNGKSACPYYKKSDHILWIKSQAAVVDPFGEEVTDIYAAAKFGIYHIDPKTKAITYIGWMPPSIRISHERKGDAFIFDGLPPVDLNKDGLDGLLDCSPRERPLGGG